MITYQKLKKFTKDVLIQIGCPSGEAGLAAEILVSADLRGIDSHGVARLKGYVRLWENNRINPNPKVKLVHETPSTGVMDGDRGLGLSVAPKAMEKAIEKAKNAGSGWISVKNSNHFGIAGYYAMMALKQDMIGIAMTNASPLVAPTYSVERLLGTNPIAVAVPAGKEPPFVADFATTTAANGKLEILQRSNKATPEGWVQSHNGLPSENPYVLSQGGALLPLGSDREHGSHKGYCLGSIVDIFSAVLSGANYGPWVPPFVDFLAPTADPVGEGIGHFFGALRIDAFRPGEEFKKHMDKWIRRFKYAKTVDGQDRVFIPGEPERATEKERRKNGIPLNAKVLKDLEKVADKVRVKALALHDV